MTKGTSLPTPYDLFMIVHAVCGHSRNAFSKGEGAPQIYVEISYLIFLKMNKVVCQPDTFRTSKMET